MSKFKFFRSLPIQPIDKLFDPHITEISTTFSQNVKMLVTAFKMNSR